MVSPSGQPNKDPRLRLSLGGLLKYKMVAAQSIFVICLVLFSPTWGYAISFTGSTELTSNDLDTDYFTLGLYSDSSCETEATNILTSSDIEYTFSSGTCTISTISIGASSLYLKINGTYHNAIDSYSISASATCTIGEVSASSVLIDLTIGGSDEIITNTPGSTMTLSEGIYTVGLDVINIEATGLDSEPSSMTLSISITAENIGYGVCSKSQSKTITATGDAVIIDTDTTDSSIERANAGNNDFFSDDPPYEFKSSVEEHTPNGQPIYMVEIAATDNPVGGVAVDGNVDFRLSIPAGVKFTIRCTCPGGGNGSKLQLDLTIDGVTKWSRFNYSSTHITGYIFNNNSLGNFAPTIYFEDANPTQVTRDLNDQNYWMSGSVIEIHIYDWNNRNDIPDNMKLDVIFWPTE